jgi:hypothetical protein
MAAVDALVESHGILSLERGLSQVPHPTSMVLNYLEPELELSVIRPSDDWRVIGCKVSGSLLSYAVGRIITAFLLGQSRYVRCVEQCAAML